MTTELYNEYNQFIPWLLFGMNWL